MAQNAKSSYERIQQLLQEDQEEIDDHFPSYGQELFRKEQVPQITNAVAVVAPPKATTITPTTKDVEIIVFHHKLQEFVDKYGLMQAPSLEDFSDLATEYSVQVDHLRIHAKDSQQLVTSSNRSTIVEQERRTERDFWSLLQVMSISDVLGIVEDHPCQQALDDALSQLSPLVTIPDYLNTAFATDLRFKKAKVIKDWLENSFRDQVVDVPAPRSPPMFETWLSIQQKQNYGEKRMEIVRGRSQLSHIHPDSQLHSAGLLALVGSDQQDQEAMLYCIWQLIRSGQVDVAQRKAFEHQAYWLASSLRGFDPHWYSIRSNNVNEGMDENEYDQNRMDEDRDQNGTLMRRGNVRHSLSTKNAYLYATQLLQSQQKSVRDVTIATQATMLEMSIYAALANNVEVLRESKFVSTWSDRLWVYANGVYNRDLIKIYQQYYDRKSQHSKLYPGCDDKTLQTNQWLKNEFTRVVQGGIDDNIGNAVPPPPTKNLECILRQLQIAFLGGVRSIKRYFDANLLDLIEPKDIYPGYEHVLRIIVHILLWCGLTPATLSAPLDQIVSQDLYYHTLEIYIAHLIESSHYELVALYARFLSPHRRVVAYARLLLAIQSDHLHRAAGNSTLSRTERDILSRKALSLAQQYFPDDLPDITRTVMEDSSKPTSLLHSRPEAPATSTSAAATNVSSNSLFLSPIRGGFGSPAMITEKAVTPGTSSLALVPMTSSSSSSSANKKIPKPSTAASSTIVPSEADRLVLESLRWVVLENSQPEQTDISKVVEVLRAVHRVIGSLLLDSQMDKVGLLPLIMDNYATEEIILRVDQHMDHLRVQQQYQPSISAEDAQKTALYEKQWLFDKDIYSLWHVLRLVHQRREEWLDCLQFIRLEQQRSLGQLDAFGQLVVGQPPMELYHHLRNLVLEELLPLIETIFVTATVDEAHGQMQHGIVTVMQESISVAETVTVKLLDDILNVLQGNVAVTDTLSTAALSLREQTLLSAQRARDDAHLLSQTQQTLQEVNTHLRSIHMDEQGRACQERLQSIQQLLPQSSIGSEALLRAYKLLQVVAARIKDVIDTQKLLSLLVYYLLQLYLSLCLRSNEALTLYESLQDSGVAETRAEILVRAFKLSDMIANEAPTLGLHRLLTTEQLEAILQDIGMAAYYLLPNGPGTLSVSNPMLA